MKGGTMFSYCREMGSGSASLYITMNVHSKLAMTEVFQIYQFMTNSCTKLRYNRSDENFKL